MTDWLPRRLGEVGYISRVGIPSNCSALLLLVEIHVTDLGLKVECFAAQRGKEHQIEIGSFLISTCELLFSFPLATQILTISLQNVPDLLAHQQHNGSRRPQAPGSERRRPR